MSSQQKDKLEGEYANYFRIGQNAIEFVIDFGQRYIGNGEACYHTRIIMNPVYAKELVSTLSSALKTYEIEYGIISNGDAEAQLAANRKSEGRPDPATGRRRGRTGPSPC